MKIFPLHSPAPYNVTHFFDEMKYYVTLIETNVNSVQRKLAPSDAWIYIFLSHFLLPACILPIDKRFVVINVFYDLSFSAWICRNNNSFIIERVRVRQPKVNIWPSRILLDVFCNLYHPFPSWLLSTWLKLHIFKFPFPLECTEEGT